ncbi:MAG TPA: hypothetical protein PK639_02130 [Candidatus Woesebacteria bacterium]|nr:hypothetical protein [Candidatus Woesebacteria bacterium]
MKTIKLLYFSSLFLIVWLTKLVFYIREFDDSVLFNWIEIILLLFIFLWFLKDIFKNESNYKININRFGIGIIVMLCLIIIISLVHNLKKQIITGYDSIALYDARARFMLTGKSFKEIVNIAPYDFLHKDYYASYPPFTSVLHLIVYVSKINIMPGFIYSVFLIMLALAFLVFYKRMKNVNVLFFLSFITISNPLVFSLSLVEYTNLPYLLYLFVGTILLYEYIKENKSWQLMMSLICLTGSFWIRFTEPIGLLIYLCFIVISLLTRRKIKLTELIGLLVVIISYLSWKIYITKIFTGSIVFGNISSIISEIILGFTNGKFISVLVFTTKGWIVWLMIYFVMFFCIRKDLKIANYLFITLVFLTVIGMYYLGIYLFSIEHYWWRDMAHDSILRSSLFLFPTSLYILGDKLVENFLKNKFNDNDEESI